MRYLSIAALLLALAAPAWAQEEPDLGNNIDLAVVQNGVVGDYTGIAIAPSGLGQGLYPTPPIEFAPYDLGRLQSPWNHVYSQGYSANGQAGLTINVPLGNGCLLHFQGGLLVAVTGGFFGSCGQ